MLIFVFTFKSRKRKQRVLVPAFTRLCASTNCRVIGYLGRRRHPRTPAPNVRLPHGTGSLAPAGNLRSQHVQGSSKPLRLFSVILGDVSSCTAKSMAGGERESEKVRLLGGFHGGVLAEAASDRGPTTSLLAVFPSRRVQDAMPHRRRMMPKTTLVAPFPSSGTVVLWTSCPGPTLPRAARTQRVTSIGLPGSLLARVILPTLSPTVYPTLRSEWNHLSSPKSALSRRLLSLCVCCLRLNQLRTVVAPLSCAFFFFCA